MMCLDLSFILGRNLSKVTKPKAIIALRFFLKMGHFGNYL